MPINRRKDERKKKHGFTLIELLAVIVILAIISLIATPIVMNVIEKSKKGAAERSAENYISTIETAVMKKRIEGQTLVDGTYNLTELETKLGTLEISGQKATAATIMIKDGQLLDGSTLEINNYVVNIVDKSGKIGEFGVYKTSEQIQGQTAGEPTITYDPMTGEKGCTQNNTDCFGWYVLEDKGTEYAYVSLIMDRNLGNKVAWCSDASLCKIDGAWNNSAGPITAMNYLKEQTSSWEVVAILPTAQQIAKSAVKTFNNSHIYGLPIWLSNYLSGYWTSTPDASRFDIAWHVYYDSIDDDEVWSARFNGVRPVITISKTELG